MGLGGFAGFSLPRGPLFLRVAEEKT